MGRTIDGLLDHEGYPAQKLPDGRLTATWTENFTAYVAACSCAGPDGWSQWYGHNRAPADR
jgi:hypothetical protein